MKLTWLFPLGLALASSACPASSEGGGGTDGSSSSTGEDPATTDATVSVTGATQGSMSNTDATMTSTMTDPATTDMPTTTDPSETADSTGTTTDDPGTTTEPETSSTGPGESSSSTGEPVTPTYGPCDLEADPDAQCVEKGESCASIPGVNPNDPDRHWCAPLCMDGDPAGCPEPTSGDATVECSGLPGAPCALSCADGETCPDGMVCFDAMFNGVMRCVWEG